MPWTIEDSLGPHSRSGYDASGWLWEIRDDGNVRRVLVEVSGSAHAVHTAGGTLSPDTENAIATRGRSEVETILEQDDPPAVIECGTTGCRPATEAHS